MTSVECSRQKAFGTNEHLNRKSIAICFFSGSHDGVLCLCRSGGTLVLERIEPAVN